MRVCSAGLLLLIVSLWMQPAAAQSLLQQYREGRFRAQAEKILDRQGLRAKPRPVAHVPSAADTLAAWWSRDEPKVEPPPPLPPPFSDARWRHLRRLERAWFSRTFSDERWAFAGNTQHSALDTTYTHHLRALLEDRFGAPTVTVVEAVESDSLVPVDPHIQFEYWAVVNDTIPVRIMDAGGPLDRGLIVASTASVRDSLTALREALGRELFGGATPLPYVDYYFDELTGLWYETGYDGQTYFRRKIPRPSLERGRPWIPDVPANQTVRD